MNLIKSFLPLLSGFVCASGFAKSKPEKLPNILWITSEDNSPFLGCYGDSLATTPNLDKLASDGIVYTHAYANAPVSAAARNTIVTGVYANSAGNEGMRSYYLKSNAIQTYPELLRKKGYYCTNNSKGDYNASNIKSSIWDEMGNSADYKNRKLNQPFFAIYNLNETHESTIHKPKSKDDLKHNPQKINLPPYHPDNETIRHDWAYYYDNVQRMDSIVGVLLKKLDESGEAENTIVFYYSDHGGVLGRSKRTLFETGTRVPLIVRIPENYKYLRNGKIPGDKDDRLVSFVDLAPTLLSITGATIPPYMQGKAFLGKQKSKAPENAFMFRGRMDERFDLSRSVRNKNFRYIINFMPYRPLGQHVDYQWKAPSMQNWHANFLQGNCTEVQSRYFQPRASEELYDTENDPWELVNLANDPAYKKELLKMRNACVNWMKSIKDAGLIPEPLRNELYGDSSLYDIVRRKDYPIDKIIDAAWFSAMADNSHVSQLLEMLKDKNPVIRHWGAVGLLKLGMQAISVKSQIINHLNDSCETVSCEIAESLYRLGEKEKATKRFVELLNSKNSMLKCYVLNSIDCLDIHTAEVQQKVNELNSGKAGEYDGRMIKYLLKKWQGN